VFGDDAEYRVRVRDPGNKAREKRLAWYSEEYLRHPFLDKDLERAAVRQITDYGRSLFEPAFGVKPVTITRTCGAFVACELISRARNFMASRFGTVFECSKPEFASRPALAERVKLADPPLEGGGLDDWEVGRFLAGARPCCRSDGSRRPLVRPFLLSSYQG